MTAKEFEPCKLRTGTHELLRIETVTGLPNDQKIEQTIWTDRTGDMLKTLMPAMGGLETYRASKAEALEKADAAELDLLPSMMVKVEPPLADAHRTKQVRYRVHLDGGDPASVFVTGPTQAVKSIDANTAEITVYAIRPGQSDGNRNAPADPPTDDDLRPNNFIQSDDPLIVADAEEGRRRRERPLARGGGAGAIRQPRGDEEGLQPGVRLGGRGGQVARGRLHRARGVPGGAVPRPRHPRPRGHRPGLPGGADRRSSTTCGRRSYIDKRWIPIDGTLALGGIGADHLKIAQSNLKDATAYSAFLPVVQIMGRLSIKIIDAK